MPLIDMPLEELYKYQGRNPRPDDFDQYWDAALAEMHALDPKVELVPRATLSRGVETFNLFFTGVGGARVHAKYLRPTWNKGPHPALVVFHGYSGRADDWNLLSSWTSAGFSVAALDCRGQAGESEDTCGVKGSTYFGHIVRGLEDKPEKLAFRSIYLDCAQLARILMGMPEVDPERVGATGGSQGGGLTLACAALEPNLKRAAPVFPFLCDYLRVWEMDYAVAAYDEIRLHFRRYDPLHQRETEIFTKLGYIDNQHLASRIKAEILMPVGMMDTVCPPSTQFAAYNKIKSKKSLLIYPDFAHEWPLPGANDRIMEFMCGLYD